MKKDVEAELRVNVRYSKCNRARRMVLNAFMRILQLNIFELEAYVDELLSVFKRIFVCVDACKKRLEGRL